MSHLGELLSAHLDGELTGAEERRVSEHLAGCSVCRAELEELHDARTAVRSMPILEMPPSVVPLLADHDAKVIPLFRRPRAWAAAAAAALMILVGLATVLAPPPPGVQVPIDDLSNQFRARDSLEPTFTPIEVVPVIVENIE
ncbi:MAG: anti-sigma factor family protein [Acidimicrobiia bacterium]